MQQPMIEPRYHFIPYPGDPVELFDRFRQLQRPQWLDCGYPRADAGRYDVLVAEPVEVVVSRDGLTTVTDAGGSRDMPGQPLAILQQRLAQRAMAPARGPFAAGAVGYMGYELGYACMDLARPAKRASSHVPDMVMALHDWSVIIDHQERTAWLARLPDAGMTEARLLALLHGSAPPVRPFSMGPPVAQPDRAGYDAAFARVSRYINDGDCYQVNLARAISAEYDGDPWDAYRRLRQISPAAHGACLLLPEAAILSISPERFLQLRHGRVETRPIKGTRPRGKDRAADQALIDDLLNSPKDRAENLMIVDLLRNDLGRICTTGSIRVPELFRIESHATVHHMVSSVTGLLRPDADACDLLASCFPGGSITGAPKRRAMEIIAELEPMERGPYCGAIGYLGYDGAMDTSIAIRTAVCNAGRIRYWAGGGLVAESRVDEEFQETLDKARAFLELGPGDTWPASLG